MKAPLVRRTGACGPVHDRAGAEALAHFSEPSARPRCCDSPGRPVSPSKVRRAIPSWKATPPCGTPITGERNGSYGASGHFNGPTLADSAEMPDAIFGQWAGLLWMGGGQELALDARLLTSGPQAKGGRRHWRSQWHAAHGVAIHVSLDPFLFHPQHGHKLQIVDDLNRSPSQIG